MNDFMLEVQERLANNASNTKLRDSALAFMRESVFPKYSYNFSWLGRPIIQYPQDIVAMQEIIWSAKPDLIIECGIAHGGSLIFSASMLALLDLCDGACGGNVDNTKPGRKVLGVDIDIRDHNLREITAHPLYRYINMIEGSSIDEKVVSQVKNIAKDYSRILVCLDSNHTHSHVLSELNAYADLVSIGSYCIVFDTIIEDLPDNLYPDRAWGVGNNPKTAVWEYLKNNPQFKIDDELNNKLMITVAPDGYLKKLF